MDFAELFSNPSMMHAAVVHMPIAAVVFGLILIVVSAIFHRNNSVRAITALMFLIASAASYVAIETGEDARGEVPNTISRAVSQTITDHADSAEKVMYSAIFTLICLLISLIRVDAVRIVGLILAAVGAIVANVFAAQTGHLGGTLVYNEGVGTPMMKQDTTPPPVVEVPVVPVPVPVEVPEGAPETTAPETPEMTETPPAEVPVVPEPVEEDPELVPISEFTLEEAKQVSFARDVWPVLDDLCVYCHEDPDADGDFVMTTLADMIKGGKKGGPGIVPGKPDESSIVLYIRGIANPRMPEDEDPLPAETLHKIRMWIAAGAIDDTNGPPAEEVAPAPEAAPAAAAPAEKMTEEAASDATSATPSEEATDDASVESAAEEMTEETPAAEAPASDAASASSPEAESTDAPAEEPSESETTDAPEAAPEEESTDSADETPASDSDASASEAPVAESESEPAAEETAVPEAAASDDASAEGADTSGATEESTEAAPESASEGQSV